MPKITVVIPLYNKAGYIRRALDSVFSQTFIDYEIIVIDDGSTDDSVDHVEIYNDSRLRIIHQENSGPGAARNRGINESRGEYIAFLDADDEWLPNYLATSFSILERNPQCGICVSAWYQDYSKGFDRVYEGKTILDAYNSMGVRFEGGHVNVNGALPDETKLMMWWTGTVFVRREILSNCYRFYGTTRHTYGEDVFLWIQLAFNHDFYRNIEPLAWYHNEASDLSSGGYRTRALEAFLLWPDQIIEKSRAGRRKEIRYWLAAYAAKSALSRLGVGQYENAIRLLKIFPDMSLVDPKRFISLLAKLILFKAGIYKPCQQ